MGFLMNDVSKLYKYNPDSWLCIGKRPFPQRICSALSVKRNVLKIIIKEWKGITARMHFIQPTFETMLKNLCMLPYKYYGCALSLLDLARQLNRACFIAVFCSFIFFCKDKEKKKRKIIIPIEGQSCEI